MSPTLNPKVEKKVHDLRKSLDSVVILILGTTIIPIIWPIMVALAPLHTFKRRSILADKDVARWFEENQDTDFKTLAKEKTIEGSLARIYLSPFLPWLPVIIPVIAILVVAVGIQFM